MIVNWASSTLGWGALVVVVVLLLGGVVVDGGGLVVVDPGPVEVKVTCPLELLKTKNSPTPATITHIAKTPTRSEDFMG